MPQYRRLTSRLRSPTAAYPGDIVLMLSDVESPDGHLLSLSDELGVQANSQRIITQVGPHSLPLFQLGGFAIQAVSMENDELPVGQYRQTGSRGSQLLCQGTLGVRLREQARCT